MSSFKGSSQDLIDMYQAASQGMENADPDVLFGGPALAKQIVHNPLFPNQPNGEDLVAAVASLDMPMQFLSFHSIVTCEGCDQIEVTAYLYYPLCPRAKAPHQGYAIAWASLESAINGNNSKHASTLLPSSVDALCLDWLAVVL